MDLTAIALGATSTILVGLAAAWVIFRRRARARGVAAELETYRALAIGVALSKTGGRAGKINVTPTIAADIGRYRLDWKARDDRGISVELTRLT